MDIFQNSQKKFNNRKIKIKKILLLIIFQIIIDDCINENNFNWISFSCLLS